ncbi:hypothetical protein [Vibrio parahaemolyticus]|uniref:hypothetical protein n=1 Tax=Vibrio parahaemolyticus TaxID=670 RepID=UPI002360A443|nr:hypothetical protein [Vibrio parahaemolyticus]ELI5409499.1 hypothetical protein [Vibrio parahaemolyticus]
MFWNRKPKESSLEQVLKDNKRKFKVNRDGFISIDLTSDEAIKAIKEQVDKIESVSLKA